MFAVIKRKSLILGVITAAVLSLLIALTAVSGSYVVAQGKTPRKLPIYCVEREDGLVSLSFDASWGSDSTEEILSTYSACFGWGAESISSPSSFRIRLTFTSILSPFGFIISIVSPTENLFLW